MQLAEVSDARYPPGPMRSVRGLLRACGLVAAMWLCGASAAMADSTVLVLGLRSVEGDDAVALKLSNALRGASEKVSGWHVRDQAVSLTQMSLAHGCDDVDALCLADIAKALNTDLLLFGTMRRSTASKDSGWSVRIESFDRRTGAIAGEASVSVSTADSATTMDGAAQALLKGLLPAPLVPSLVVKTNVPGAELRLNGQLMGQFQGAEFIVRDLEAGRYLLLVSALGYQSYERAVELEGGKAAALEANLRPTDLLTGATPTVEPPSYEESGGIPTWLPVSLFITSGLSLAATAVIWTGIRAIEDDPLYKSYGTAIFVTAEKRNEMGANIALSDLDVCAEAADNPPLHADADFSAADVPEVQDLCSRGETLEILQWVALGLAGATAATGIVLLLVDASDDGAAAATGPSLAIKPDVGRRRAGVTATLRF